MYAPPPRHNFIEIPTKAGGSPPPHRRGGTSCCLDKKKINYNRPTYYYNISIYTGPYRAGASYLPQVVLYAGAVGSALDFYHFVFVRFQLLADVWPYRFLRLRTVRTVRLREYNHLLSVDFHLDELFFSVPLRHGSGKTWLFGRPRVTIAHLRMKAVYNRRA